MNFKYPFYKTETDNLFYLAPIPLWIKVFDDDDLHTYLYEYGYNNMTESQKLMGQELPFRYDVDRQLNFDMQHESYWVESSEKIPIGSRYFTPPNDFLNINDNNIKYLKDRILNESNLFVKSVMGSVNQNSTIPESWIQYYNPTAGRGHNKHNHCRWSPEEETQISLSGGYYLSDGNPIKDHPYSGVFSFHLRGSNYFIRPKRGMLMLWPNDVVHSVYPFYGKSHRCVINFNIQYV
jgi:hypothetical protein